MLRLVRRQNMSKEEEKKGEKPKIELMDPKGLYTVALCNPVKDQLNQIKICRPNIEVTTCSPLDRIRCIPDVWCRPFVYCLPDTWCLPKTWCLPFIGPCRPVIGPCGPWVEGTCGPSVEIPVDQIGEIAVKVEKLTAEIEALKKKVSK